jgi:RNase P subunit RPR2
MNPATTCKQCQSTNCAVFPADVRLYLNRARTVSAPPMNPGPSILTCLECGWSEFYVPDSWLAARWLRPIQAPAYMTASPVAAD